jgi:hypothetical protein
MPSRVAPRPTLATKCCTVLAWGPGGALASYRHDTADKRPLVSPEDSAQERLRRQEPEVLPDQEVGRDEDPAEGVRVRVAE